MNKKVLSAILFSALFAGTGTFTSCIDNDEPAGIEELRGAKAELLRAQKLVAEADAAFKLAKAEVKKAEAAKKMAEAKIAEAQAEFEAARADSMGSAAGLAELRYQEALAKYERDAEIAIKQHELDLISKDSAIAVAERQFQIAAAQIKIAQALMSEEASLELDSLINKRDTAYADYLVASNTYEDAYADYLMDYTYYKIDSTYATRKAEIDVEENKAALVAAEEKLAKYEKYLNSDSIYNAETWRKEIADLEKKIADLEKKIAVFKVDSGRKLNGEDYKNLVLAEEAAEKALSTEKDSLRDGTFVLSEDVADTLMYAESLLVDDQKPEDYVVSYAKGDYKLNDVLKKLAGNSYLTFTKTVEDTTKVTVAENYDSESIIAKLQNEHDSYTAERAYWLDSIAAMDEEAKEGAQEWADSVVKIYQAAKEAYLATTPMDELNEAKDDVDELIDGYAAALAAAAPKDAEKDTAAVNKELREALVKFYDAAAKNGLTLNTVVIGNTYDATTGKPIYTAKSVKDYMSTDANFKILLDSLKTNGQSVNYFTTIQNTDVNSNGIKKEYVNGTAKVYSYWTGAISANYDDSYLTALQDASKLAFGNYALYDGNDYSSSDIEKNEYLHNVPDTADVMYVVRKVKGDPTLNLLETDKVKIGENEYTYNVNLGVWGYHLYTMNDETQFLVNNHKAIKADLKAAIDKWTALVDEIVAETKAAVDDINEAIAAKTVAEKAVTNFETAVEQEYNKNTAGLVFSEKYWRNQLISLTAAVNAFLDVDTNDTADGNGYTGEKEFKNWLKSQIKILEGKDVGSLVYLEEQLAEAEAKLELAKQGLFDEDAIDKDIEETAEELAEAKAEMEACKAAYEKAQADFDLAWKIWSEFFAAE